MNLRSHNWLGDIFLSVPVYLVKRKTVIKHGALWKEIMFLQPPLVASDTVVFAGEIAFCKPLAFSFLLCCLRVVEC